MFAFLLSPCKVFSLNVFLCFTSRLLIVRFYSVHRDLGSNNITVLQNQSFFMLTMLEEL